MTFDACYCDGPTASVYRAKLRKARTQHKCYECGRKILPGEQYENVFAIWEGDAQTCCTCSHCLDLREFVKSHVPCFCWNHGNIIEEAHETAEYYAHEADGLLFGAWRRKVLIRRAWKEQRK